MRQHHLYFSCLLLCCKLTVHLQSQVCRGRLRTLHPQGQGGDRNLPRRLGRGGAQKSLARAGLSTNDRCRRTETR